LCLRASAGLQRRIWFIPVAISYTAAFIFLGRTLAAGMPLGVAYGLWAACGVALVCLLSRVIWKDPLTRRALIGIGLIVIGVARVEPGWGSCGPEGLVRRWGRLTPGSVNPRIPLRTPRELLSSSTMARFGFVDPHRRGVSAPNRVRPSCGFADDSWEAAAIGWWGGEP